MRLRTKTQLALLDDPVWVLLAVFFIANVLFASAFLSIKSQLNILCQSATFGPLALDMGIVTMVEELDLSVEATLAFTPGTMILVAQQLSPGPMVCTSMTLALGMAVDFFNDFFVAKMKTNSPLLTMPSQTIMQGLVLFLVPFSLTGLDRDYTFLGRGRIGSLQVAILALIVVYIIFELTFHKTVPGCKLAPIGDSCRAAHISSISTGRVIICALVLVGLLSVVAGLVIAGRQNAVPNSMGKDVVMMAFAGTTLGGCSFNGGMGRPVGMLGGTLLLGMINNALDLDGVNVNLVNVTKGGLISPTIILDQLHFKTSVDIMHRENMRKLVQSNS